MIKMWVVLPLSALKLIVSAPRKEKKKPARRKSDTSHRKSEKTLMSDGLPAARSRQAAGTSRQAAGIARSAPERPDGPLDIPQELPRHRMRTPPPPPKVCEEKYYVQVRGGARGCGEGDEAPRLPHL